MKTKITIFFLMIFNGAIYAQNKISGVAKDQDGNNLYGASISVKGTTLGAFTDSLGNFSINTQSLTPPFTIEVSFVGYNKIEKIIKEITNSPIEFILPVNNSLGEVQIVSSRRREEAVQDIPIPITVIGGAKTEEAGAFNVNRVKELVPSVQLYSSNPRNTTLNIRGLGSTFGLTNDGIDPGVGYYIDGVYYARPAATTLDFIDLDRIEVLRGPQGTLFGKNTTAGALNITTRKPTFTPEGNVELSYGNFQFVQARASVSGGLSKKVAARISFSGTQRDGLIENVRTGNKTNTLNNQGVRAQFLITPKDNLNIIIAGNYNVQKPNGYAQVFAGVAPTERAAYRQFENIAKDLNYSVPSQNPFDRKIDHDTPWKSNQDLGGASVNVDYKIGPGTLTSTTAWAFWNWDPSNDRDFTGIQALRLSQNPSKQQQFSQEFRYAGQISEKLSGVIGLYGIDQSVKVTGTEESGKDQWRYSQSSTSNLWKTPGLLDGYGIKTNGSISSASAAVFAQADWNLFKGLHILPGIRYNYDEKIATFERNTYGGLQTNDSKLIAIKNGIYRNQYYHKGTYNTNLSGNLTVSYRFSDRFNVYATYSTAYKPVGVNVAGLPSTSTGEADLSLAIIKPEYVTHTEVGFKSSPIRRSTFNITAFNTDIDNYQTNVQSPELGVNRGYLANAEKVNVKGIEVEGTLAIQRYFSVFVNGAYTDGRYVKFTNAPLPLEETGKTVDGKQVAFKDVSGGKLPGISDWSGSAGAEYSLQGKLLTNNGRYFIASEVSYRSKYSSSPTPSKYLNINEYSLVNARIGFKATKGLSFFVWSRNLLNTNYFEQLLPASGNVGHFAGVLGDQRTYGLTLKYAF